MHLDARKMAGGAAASQVGQGAVSLRALQLHSELFINATVLLLVEAAVLDRMRPTKKARPQSTGDLAFRAPKGGTNGGGGRN